jgi:disulfide bond formation protein DsbB
MSTEALSAFFAVLSLAAWAGTVAVVVLLAAGGRAGEGSALRTLRDDVGAAGLWLGCLVAAVAMGGSLYYSEVAHFVPCELCWYQRICMYPLALILLIAAVRRDRGIVFTVVPLAGIGAAIAAYHTQLQAFPEQRSFCPTTTPCTTRYVWQFGFVSLPFMALAGFCLIIALAVLARVTAGRPSASGASDGADPGEVRAPGEPSPDEGQPDEGQPGAGQPDDAPPMAVANRGARP